MEKFIKESQVKSVLDQLFLVQQPKDWGISTTPQEMWNDALLAVASELEIDLNNPS